MRLALIISSLGPGGAEAVLAALAAGWVKRGHGVELITLASVREDRQSLPDSITRTALDLQANSRGTVAAIAANSERIRALRRCLQQRRPDVVISFGDATNVLTLLATAGLRVPSIISERVDPASHPIGSVWRLARRATYPRASAVVAPTLHIAAWLSRFVPADRVRHIVNPVRWSREPGVSEIERTPGDRILLCVGRLAHQKGLDILLDAFGRIATEHPHWKLLILGDGPERANLEVQCAQLGLTGRVAILGYKPDPWAAAGQAEIFVLPSRYEGLPNALLEALARGIPAVVTDCPGVAGEVVVDGLTGLVVPREDPARMAQAIADLIAQPERRRAIGQRARESMERYQLDNILDTWERVLQGAQRSRQPRWP